MEVGIAYLVSGGKFFPILTVDGTVWSRKLLIALWLGRLCSRFYTRVSRLRAHHCCHVATSRRSSLYLRTSVIFEATINFLSVSIFLPLLVITYTIDPKYGCTYYFSLPFTEFYISLEEAMPITNSLLSLCFSLYLILKIVISMRVRRRLSRGSAISALELSNIATLVLLDLTHIVVYIPNGIVFILISIANLNSKAFDSGFIFVPVFYLHYPNTIPTLFQHYPKNI